MSVRARTLLLALLLLALSSVACGGDDEVEPAEGGGEITSVPRVGEGDQPRFGYNEFFQPDARDIPLLPGSGSDTARRLISWGEIEPEEDGGLNWGGYDVLYEQFTAQGVRPTWVLVGAPCWAAAVPEAQCAAEGSGGLAPAVDRAEELGEFLAAVTERYPESLGIEVGNETNLDRFWTGGLDPDAYAVLLEASAEAVHEVDPEMPVVAGGLAPISEPEPGKLPWIDFLEAIYESGANESIDAISFHPYAGIEADEDSLPTVLGLLDDVDSFLETVDDEEMPVWITEIGLTTAGQFAVSPEQQADGLVEIYDALVERDVPVIHVHRFNDEPDPEFPAEKGYGVMEADEATLKPAYCALAEARGLSCR